MDSQLKRGILNICILQILKQQDMYGYDIVKIIQGFFEDTEESTVYGILRRLNNDGMLDVYLGEVSGGPQRKYYKVTEKGMECLEDYVASLQVINNILKKIGIS